MKHFNPLPWIVLLSLVLVCVTVMSISVTEGMTNIRYVDESEIILTPESPFYKHLKSIDIGSKIIILTDSTLAMNDVVKNNPGSVYLLSNFKENTEDYIKQNICDTFDPKRASTPLIFTKIDNKNKMNKNFKLLLTSNGNEGLDPPLTVLN
jgi:hypothetical protein